MGEIIPVPPSTICLLCRTRACGEGLCCYYLVGEEDRGGPDGEREGGHSTAHLPLSTPGGRKALQNGLIPVPAWGCPRAAGPLLYGTPISWCEAQPGHSERRRHVTLRDLVVIKPKEKFSVRDVSRQFLDPGVRSPRPVVFELFFFFFSRTFSSQDLKANPLSATFEEPLGL